MSPSSKSHTARRRTREKERWSPACCPAPFPLTTAARGLFFFKNKITNGPQGNLNFGQTLDYVCKKNLDEVHSFFRSTVWKWAAGGFYAVCFTESHHYILRGTLQRSAAVGLRVLLFGIRELRAQYPRLPEDCCEVHAVFLPPHPLHPTRRF